MVSGNAMMISLPFVLRKAGVPVPEITSVMSMLACTHVATWTAVSTLTSSSSP